MKKVDKGTKSQKDDFKEIHSVEEWKKDNLSSSASIKEVKNSKAISITNWKTFPSGAKVRGNGIWVWESMVRAGWVEWAIKSLKSLYLFLTGKELKTEDQIEFYENQLKNLTAELAETQKKLDESKVQKEAETQLIDLAKKSAQRLEDPETIFVKLQGIVTQSYENSERKEEEVKKEIKLHNWLVGLECYVDAKNKDIDTQTNIDLHVRTRYEQDRIFEVKSPDIVPFKEDTKNPDRRLKISPELAEALSEIILYMRKTDIYSDKKSKGTYGIQKASGVILMGYKLNDDQKEMLKELNFHLRPHIELITYDQLLFNIRQELDMVKRFKDTAHKL